MANLRPESKLLIKKTKDEAEYSMGEVCKICNHFYPSGACEIVEGAISPEAYCKFWTPIESRSGYKDREYFQKEYDKMHGGGS